MTEYDPETSLFPTHSCFDDSLEFLEYVVRAYPEKASTLLLVHAICVARTDEKEFAHAWVEDTTLNVVILAGIVRGERSYYASRMEAFYGTYNVRETTKYTVKEVLEHNIKHGTYGPWEDKYIALCGDQPITMGVAGQLQLSPIGSIPMKGK